MYNCWGGRTDTGLCEPSGLPTCFHQKKPDLLKNKATLSHKKARPSHKKRQI